jgi:hypothetical protein
MGEQSTLPVVARHGAHRLPSVEIDSYNVELKDNEGFIGDRASRDAFRNGSTRFSPRRADGRALQRIQDTMAALVAEIGSQSDSDKEPEPGVADDVVHSGMIRCVAGRTELDFAVATILAQLLTRKGRRAEVIANPAVSRGNIGSFSQEGVSLVGVCYIDVSGTIAPIRFLLRRLRQRLPEARLPSGQEIMRSHAIAIFRAHSR